MQGIYDGVKQGDLALAAQRFGHVLEGMRRQHGDVPVIMGCTEIPLALPQAPKPRAPAWSIPRGSWPRHWPGRPTRLPEKQAAALEKRKKAPHAEPFLGQADFSPAAAGWPW
jgi:hypothetical protein